MSIRDMSTALILTALAASWSSKVEAGSFYEQTVLADHPTAYYRLGELSGSTAVDSSGNGHNGTYLGGVALGQSGAIVDDPNTSAGFNGTSSIVDTNFKPADLSFTIEAWIKPSSAVSQQQVIGGEGGWAALVYNGADVSGHAEITAFDGTQFFGVSTPQTLPLNQWSYLVGTWDNTSKVMNIYLDGVLDASLSFPGKTVVPGDPFGRFQIGAFNETLHGGTYNAQYFQGGIDEVAYYSYALSADQIGIHYEAGISSVPEPSALILTLIGGVPCGLVVLRSKRRRLA
jgi:hypothetical protein